MSLMASACPFFQLDVLDEILDFVGSVSEGFLTYNFKVSRKTAVPLIIRWKWLKCGP